jgi:hypothetical protein
MLSADPSNTPLLLWLLYLVIIPLFVVMVAVTLGVVMRHSLRRNPRLIGRIQLLSLAGGLGLLVISLSDLLVYHVLDSLLILWIAPVLLAIAMQAETQTVRRAAERKKISRK